MMTLTEKISRAMNEPSLSDDDKEYIVQHIKRDAVSKEFSNLIGKSVKVNGASLRIHDVVNYESNGIPVLRTTITARINRKIHFKMKGFILANPPIHIIKDESLVEDARASVLQILEGML